MDQINFSGEGYFLDYEEKMSARKWEIIRMNTYDNSSIEQIITITNESKDFVFDVLIRNNTFFE